MALVCNTLSFQSSIKLFFANGYRTYFSAFVAIGGIADFGMLAMAAMRKLTFYLFCIALSALLQCSISTLSRGMRFLSSVHRVTDPKQIFERNNAMNIVRSFNNWRTYRNTVGELVQLSDRELNDMGIGRADIRNVARRAVGK